MLICWITKRLRDSLTDLLKFIEQRIHRNKKFENLTFPKQSFLIGILIILRKEEKKIWYVKIPSYKYKCAKISVNYLCRNRVSKFYKRLQLVNVTKSSENFVRQLLVQRQVYIHLPVNSNTRKRNITQHRRDQTSSTNRNNVETFFPGLTRRLC